jgi:hypothetical protein
MPKRFTEQERQLIEILREWSDSDDVRLELEYKDGVWEIILSRAPHDSGHTARGTGATFAQAWDNVNPMWA